MRICGVWGHGLVVVDDHSSRDIEDLHDDISCRVVTIQVRPSGHVYSPGSNPLVYEHHSGTDVAARFDIFAHLLLPF